MLVSCVSLSFPSFPLLPEPSSTLFAPTALYIRYDTLGLTTTYLAASAARTSDRPLCSDRSTSSTNRHPHQARPRGSRAGDGDDGQVGAATAWMVVDAALLSRETFDGAGKAGKALAFARQCGLPFCSPCSLLDAFATFWRRKLREKSVR